MIVFGCITSKKKSDSDGIHRLMADIRHLQSLVIETGLQFGCFIKSDRAGLIIEHSIIFRLNGEN